MKRCSFCSGIIEDNVGVCPYCGTANVSAQEAQTAAIDFGNPRSEKNNQAFSAQKYQNIQQQSNQGFSVQAYQNIQQQSNQGFGAPTNQNIPQKSNQGFSAQAYQNIQQHSNSAGNASNVYQATSANPGFSPMPVTAVSWKDYYKSHAGTATKVAVIICAVFAFLTFTMEIVQFIASLAQGGGAFIGMNSTLIYAALAIELVAYVGMGVTLLITKQWWTAAVMTGVSAISMLYNLIVYHSLTSYLILCFAIWAMVSLIKLHKKYKNEMS